MNQIEDYVNSVYKNVEGDKKEIEELKEEMKSHLAEAVYEWKMKGKSEEEAVRIAIENFGDKKQITKGLSEFFSVQKRFSRYILFFSFVSLAFGIFFFANILHKTSNFENEKKVITNDVLSVLDSSDEINEQQKQQLLNIYKLHSNHLNHLAVFSLKENPNLKNWLSKNNIKNNPTTIFPLEYKNAELIIGQKGEISNKEDIVGNGYDLGTVAKANDDWIVQYEYSVSYSNVIETNNSLKLKNYMDVFQLPILFFIVFGVLIIIWSVLKKHHKHLMEIIG